MTFWEFFTKYIFRPPSWETVWFLIGTPLVAIGIFAIVVFVAIVIVRILTWKWTRIELGKKPLPGTNRYVHRRCDLVNEIGYGSGKWWLLFGIVVLGVSGYIWWQTLCGSLCFPERLFSWVSPAAGILFFLVTIKNTLVKQGYLKNKKGKWEKPKHERMPIWLILLIYAAIIYVGFALPQWIHLETLPYSGFRL